jgi:hypothetical protein
MLHQLSLQWLGVDFVVVGINLHIGRKAPLMSTIIVYKYIAKFYSFIANVRKEISFDICVIIFYCSNIMQIVELNKISTI